MRLRIGVIGCGAIAQIMHLPDLTRRPDLFDVAAVCDLSPSLVEAVGDRFGVPKRVTAWPDLLEERLDAVLVLTPGDHSQIAIDAAKSGHHVFVEKPMCLTVDDGRSMAEAADGAGVRMMVGQMKRFDPAFVRLREELSAFRDLRFATGLTLESPELPYFEHHRLLRPRGHESKVEAEIAATQARDRLHLADSLRTDDPFVIHAYRSVLLDSMIHDIDLVRGALGEPSRLDHARLHEHGVTATLVFDGIPCTLSWVALPGIARYRQEFAFYAPERRARLVFPSPYLRNAPTTLLLEHGEVGSTRSWETTETASHEEAFEIELLEFHAAITQGREPATGVDDGLRNVALCAAIARAHIDERPQERPTDLR